MAVAVTPTVPTKLITVARRAQGRPEGPSLRSARTGRRNVTSGRPLVLIAQPVLGIVAPEQGSAKEPCLGQAPRVMQGQLERFPSPSVPAPQEIAVEAAQAAKPAAPARPRTKARQDLRIASGEAPPSPASPSVAPPRAATEASACAQGQELPMGPSRHRLETSMGVLTSLTRTIPVVQPRKATQTGSAPTIAPRPSAQAQPVGSTASRARPAVLTTALETIPLAVTGACSGIERQELRPVAPATKP